MDERIDPRRYESGADVLFGLRSAVARQGHPDGYEAAVNLQLFQRLQAIASTYGLTHVTMLELNGTMTRMDAGFLVRELDWLPRVSSDPLILESATQLRAIAAACMSSPMRDEALVVRIP